MTRKNTRVQHAFDYNRGQYAWRSKARGARPNIFKRAFWKVPEAPSGKKLYIIGISIVLIFLATGFLHPLLNEAHATSFNGFGHTRTQIYSTLNPFATGTGDLLNTWNFNYTNAPSRTDVCVGLQSSTQIRFKYDQGKIATSYGPFTFAATDTGNSIDLQQQQKIFYAQGRWWIFFINTTGTNPNKVIFTSSKSGSNATLSWRAGGTFPEVAGIGNFASQRYSVTSYFANIPNYVVWNNASHVFLVHTSASGVNTQLRFVVGTLSTTGTITWGTDQTVATATLARKWDTPQVIVYSSTPFISVIIAGLTNSTTANDMVAYYSTAFDYSTWSAQKILHSATGGQISHTAWYNQPGDLLNGSLYLPYSSSNGDYSGVQGIYATVFTRPSTWGTEETVFNSNNAGWFPYGVTGIASNDLVMAYVNGTGSNLNQVFLWNERKSGVWGSSVPTGVPTAYDLSSGAIWDSSHATFYFINQLTTKNGISGWWNSTTSSNTNRWTNTAVNKVTNSNMTTFFRMNTPTDGNVSIRYNRMNQDIRTVTVTDGNIRAGTFWTEGNGAAPVDANAYRLVFGSIIMPQGKANYGNNCNSADIAILKSPINFQVASGKQLEFFMSWDCQSDGVALGCLGYNPDFSQVDVALRENATLPSFTEGYVPENDPTVRLIYRYHQTSIGTFNTFIYAGHSESTSIANEGLATDLVTGNIVLGTPACTAGYTNLYAQFILNFTGPQQGIFMQQTNPNGSNCWSSGDVSYPGLATGNFQPGKDYYLMVKVSWGLALDPAPNEFIDFRTGDTNGNVPKGTGGNITPTTTSFYSDPASCSDVQAGNHKLAACGALANPTPEFNINPLDPSSWSNAIIKGFVWVFTTIFQSAGQMIGYVVPVLISVFDTVGNFLGLGSIGTQMSSLFSTIGGLITNVFSNFFSWSTQIIGLIGSSFTALATILTLYFTQIGSFFSGVVGFLSILITVLSDFLQFSKLPVSFIIILWWTMGIYRSYDDGIDGFLAWVDMSEAVMFKGLNILLWFAEETFKAIARLRTILPRPFGL